MLKAGNKYKNVFKTSILIFIIIFNIISCTDKNIIINQSKSIKKYEWHYTDKITFTADINDINSKYLTKVYIRHTNDYKYSNLFFLITSTSPSNVKKTYRCEYPLANQEGVWLGSTTNNLYTVSLVINELDQFNEPGVWKFTIEQNMRDDILANITDVGIIIKKNNK